MRSIIYNTAALRDIEAIVDYVARESGSGMVALRFAEDIADRCMELASLPGTLGRRRDDIRDGLRSATIKSYVIFFRYHPSTIEVVNVLHGQRDIVAHFRGDLDF